MPCVLIGVCALVYLNSFQGKFMLDDARSIVENERIRDLSDLATVTRGVRPIVNLTFAINYKLGEFEVTGYHLLNLVVHLLAGLTLFGIIRRLSLTPALADRYGRAGPWLALIIATIWVVHPLQTQSVTYIVQRAESMMGLFYLLTIYCVLRGATVDKGVCWYILAVVAAGIGMGCKAVIVTVPVVVLLMDIVFLTGSVKRSLSCRYGVYVGLVVAVVGVLVITGRGPALFDTSRSSAAVGFGMKSVTWQSYAQSQPGVILHYLWLSLWPQGLCLDHMWRPPQSAAGYVPQTFVLWVLAGLTLWAIVRRHWLGFVGAFFFIVLAPTSSVVPIADRMFEHRMYLPLAAVVTVVVAGGHWLVFRFVREGSRSIVAAWVVGGIVVALGARTIVRNNDYHDNLRMWKSISKHAPHNARAQVGIASALFERGDLSGAEAHVRMAIKGKRDYARAYFVLGRTLAQDRSRTWEAEAAFAQAVALRPNDASFRYNHGASLYELGRLEESEAELRFAIKRQPAYLNAHTQLGLALWKMGREDEAVAAFNDALAINPKHPLALEGLARIRGDSVQMTSDISELRSMLHDNPGDILTRYRLAIMLKTAGDIEEAETHLRAVLRENRNHAPAHVNLGTILLEKGDVEGAIKSFRLAIEVDPELLDAYINLGGVLSERNELEEAERINRQAVELAPDSAMAHNNLAFVLFRMRRQPEALEEYESAVNLDPTMAIAVFGRGLTHAMLGDLDQAILDYERTLQLDPQHPVAQDALERAKAMKASQDQARQDTP